MQTIPIYDTTWLPLDTAWIRLDVLIEKLQNTNWDVLFTAYLLSVNSVLRRLCTTKRHEIIRGRRERRTYNTRTSNAKDHWNEKLCEWAAAAAYDTKGNCISEETLDGVRWWMRVCFFKWSRRPNRFEHTEHEKGRWPEWMRLCRVSSSLRVNVLPHDSSSHLYGRSPGRSEDKKFSLVDESLWLNRVRLSGTGGYVEWIEIERQLPVWLRTCPLSCPLLLKATLQWGQRKRFGRCFLPLADAWDASDAVGWASAIGWWYGRWPGWIGLNPASW